MKLFKRIALFTLIIVLMVAFLKWTDARDKKLEIAVAKYEECVKTQMHTTVMAYYNEHGEFPECSNDQVTVEYK